MASSFYIPLLPFGTGGGIIDFMGFGIQDDTVGIFGAVNTDESFNDILPNPLRITAVWIPITAGAGCL